MAKQDSQNFTRNCIVFDDMRLFSSPTSSAKLVRRVPRIRNHESRVKFASEVSKLGVFKDPREISSAGF